MYGQESSDKTIDWLTQERESLRRLILGMLRKGACLSWEGFRLKLMYSPGIPEKEVDRVITELIESQRVFQTETGKLELNY